MPRDPQFPRIVRRKSKLHGFGVFALEPINKNKRIVRYEGELIDHKESYKRETKYLKRGQIWCFTVNRRWVRDAMVGGNVARFINHSCQPNCYVQIIDGVIWIRAAKTIRPGQELTYHYNTDGEALIKCRCRPGCQTLL
jgi:SET domain-containing protein